MRFPLKSPLRPPLSGPLKIGALGSGFTPADLSPVLWLDASTIVGSGGVATWEDQSGNNYDATQPTGGNQPQTGTRTVNGLNALDFDGTADYMLISGLPTTIPQGPNSLFIVYATDTPTSEQNFISGMVGGTDSYKLSIYSFGGDFTKAENMGSVDSARVVDTDQHIAGLVRDGANITSYSDSVSASNTNATNMTVTNGWRIGRSDTSGGQKYVNGVICEIVMLDYAATGAQALALQNYYYDKWFPAPSLDALFSDDSLTDPYYSDDPFDDKYYSGDL